MNSKPRITWDSDNGAWTCGQLPKDGESGSKFLRHELIGWGDTPKQAFAEYCSYAGIENNPKGNMKNLDLEDFTEKRILAMYHLEVCFEPMDEKGSPKPKEWVDAHITAAHYLIQSMFGGFKPKNYEEVMAEARRFDAIDETNCATYLAKKAA